jgi:DNA repair protein RadC
MPTIREWPDSDRPRERLEALDAGVLPVRELLAIILGSGSSGRSALDLGADILSRFGGSLRRLGMAEPAELRAIPGIGPARAATITAALEIGRRLATEPTRRGDRIRGPGDVFQRLGPLLRDRKQEEFWVLYLDSQNRVLSDRRITVGLLNSSLVHPREVFAPAIAHAAASLILAHNHPSGDPDPSPEDLDVTVQMVESGRLLGIPVRDHIVLGDSTFVSLLERGLMVAERAGIPARTRARLAGYRCRRYQPLQPQCPVFPIGPSSGTNPLSS